MPGGYVNSLTKLLQTTDIASYVKIQAVPDNFPIVRLCRLPIMVLAAV